MKRGSSRPAVGCIAFHEKGFKLKLFCVEVRAIGIVLPCGLEIRSRFRSKARNHNLWGGNVAIWLSKSIGFRRCIAIVPDQKYSFFLHRVLGGMLDRGSCSSTGLKAERPVCERPPRPHSSSHVECLRWPMPIHTDAERSAVRRVPGYIARR